jgi:hypothetical protein
MKKMMIQITSGKGPAECCRIVVCMQSFYGSEVNFIRAYLLAPLPATILPVIET